MLVDAISDRIPLDDIVRTRLALAYSTMLANAFRRIFKVTAAFHRVHQGGYRGSPCHGMHPPSYEHLGEGATDDQLHTNHVSRYALPVILLRIPSAAQW